MVEQTEITKMQFSPTPTEEMPSTPDQTRSPITRTRSRCTAQFDKQLQVKTKPKDMDNVKMELSPLSDIHADHYPDLLSPIDDEDMVSQLEMFGYTRVEIMEA